MRDDYEIAVLFKQESDSATLGVGETQVADSKHNTSFNVLKHTQSFKLYKLFNYCFFFKYKKKTNNVKKYLKILAYVASLSEQT